MHKHLDGHSAVPPRQVVVLDGLDRRLGDGLGQAVQDGRIPQQTVGTWPGSTAGFSSIRAAFWGTHLVKRVPSRKAEDTIAALQECSPSEICWRLRRRSDRGECWEDDDDEMQVSGGALGAMR